MASTNVPDVAMCFSDARFAYGPFAPHYIPRQYVENYFTTHQVDSLLVLNTTVEDISKLPPLSKGGSERWKLTLRKYDAARHVDVWWEEVFDAVIIANGHYSVPYVRSPSPLLCSPLLPFSLPSFLLSQSDMTRYRKSKDWKHI